MNIIYVDDEGLAIRRFELLAKDIKEIYSLHLFNDTDDAAVFAAGNIVDLAFLDINMPKTDGLEFARQLRRICPDIRIVFITAYDYFALDAYHVDALGYLTKPFTKEQLIHEIGKAKRIKSILNHRVYIQTMPRFDIFIDDEILVFPGKKSKELLALLVDHGGEVSNDYAITYLWENRPYDEATKTLYRVLKKNLKNVLAAAGIEGILGDARTKISVNKTMFACDYYDLLNGDKTVARKFDGRYMFEYPWAEQTALKINKYCKL